MAPLSFLLLCLSEKYVGLQNLIQRNEHLYSSGNAPSGGVSLPFILVQVNFAKACSRSTSKPISSCSWLVHCLIIVVVVVISAAPDSSSCDCRSGNIRRYAARAFRFQQVQELKTRCLIFAFQPNVFHNTQIFYMTHLFSTYLTHLFSTYLQHSIRAARRQLCPQDDEILRSATIEQRSQQQQPGYASQCGAGKQQGRR